MFMDAKLLVSDAQSVASTAVSTHTIDTSDTSVQRAIGTGELCGFGVSVDVAAVHTTADETYEFQIVEDGDPALGSPSVVVSVQFTAAMYAQLAAGKRLFLPLPPGYPRERYIGLKYVLGGNADNAITVTAWFTLASMFSIEPENYPRNYAV